LDPGQGLEWKARSAVGMLRVICWWDTNKMWSVFLEGVGQGVDGLGT